jgi:hypothetical protein
MTRNEEQFFVRAARQPTPNEGRFVILERARQMAEALRAYYNSHSETCECDLCTKAELAFAEMRKDV